MHVKEIVLITFLTGVGGFLFIAGIIFAISWPEIFDSILAQEMKLAPNTRAYEAWKQPPIPLSFDIYLYNWTNPDEINNSSVKPVLQQLGPYRFTEKPDKVDITWNPANSTVSYRKLSQFLFDQEGSKGSLDDVVTTVNVVALSAAEKGRHSDYMRAKSIALGLSLYSQKISVTKTAGELLFEGYEDDMVSLAKSLPFLAGEEIPFDRVGWFYMRNNSADLTGWYNVDTGAQNIGNIGVLKYWNFEDTNNAFDGECGKITGSAGEFYPPKQKRGGSISFFTPDMCRTVPLDYEKDVEIHGVKGFKYRGGPRSVDNGKLYPETACFSPGELVPAGTLNISSCRFGTPVFMSYPHFYQADPYYLSLVEGLNPEEEKHQMYMSLEPMTGIALDVAARLQLNLLIRPNPNIPMYNDVNTVFMPILWFEQVVTLPEEMTAEIKMAISIPLTGRICAIVVIFIGLIILLWYPVRRLIRRRAARVYNADKGSAKVITTASEEMEKQTNKPEDSPLLDCKKKTVELTPVNNLTLSMEKIPYIDAIAQEKSGSMSLLHDNHKTKN